MSTSLRSVDMIFRGLTIRYVYLLTIWHLYSDWDVYYVIEFIILMVVIIIIPFIEHKDVLFNIEKLNIENVTYGTV